MPSIGQLAAKNTFPLRAAIEIGNEGDKPIGTLVGNRTQITALGEQCSIH